jgi:hypothetical protein
MKHLLRRVFLAGALLGAWTAVPPKAGAQAPPEKTATPEQIAFFEKSIRPVLVKECYSCHATNAKKIRGGLTLDTRDGIRKGGDTGPAVVPGDTRKSLIVKALRHTQDDLKMPPKKKLTADVIADFEKWVAMGAPDPRDGTTTVKKKNEIDIVKGRTFWAFQPPKRPTPPAVKNEAWPKDDIDRYLLAALEAKKLTPVADADARTLLRRVYFDLTGLPPTPEDVEAFATEYAASPDAALESVVDRLLASPRFGERWGRHWLDVARYAESSGRANNFAYPNAWRYRDYVLSAFNADKPYDQFIREQLAGDLLTPKDDVQKTEFLTATGFLAIGPKTHNERNRRQFEMDVADEQIDATFQAFQGLTAACARCHDHKFDPIPQKDYYALSGIFRSTQTCYGTIRIIQSNHPSPLVELPKNGGATVGLEPLTSERRASIEKQRDDLRERATKVTGQNAFIQRIFLSSRRSVLASQLAMYESDGTPKLLAMGVRERYAPTDSRLYVRGELDQPGETVKRGFPQVLTTKQPDIPRGSGRRELADFIASKDNPLTARVMANRVWLHLMGRGLVATPDNFGASGQRPSHPELLDHLALTFTDNGWSVKKTRPHDRPQPRLSPVLAVRRQELRGRSRRRAGLADAETPSGSRSAARYHVEPVRPAQPHAAEGQRGEPQRRREHRLPLPRRRSGDDRRAPHRLPADCPRSGAGSADLVRLPRSEPHPRRAGDDDRAGPVALPDEQSVRPPPGRGAGRETPGWRRR